MRNRLFFVLLLVGIVGASCQAADAPSGSGVTPSGSSEASPSAEPSTDGPSPSSTPSPPGTPAASPQPMFAVDSMVEAVVEGLRVREEPGLDGRSLGTLPRGAGSIVVVGPVSADGFEWYRLRALGLSMGTGCEGPFVTTPYTCPSWFGWVAARGPDGAAWLVADDACPAWPGGSLTTEFVFGVEQLRYLACFGGDTRTVAGYYPVIPEDAGLGGTCEVPDAVLWLGCNFGYEHLVIDPADGFGAPGFQMVVAPGVAMPERGHLIEVTGHYDDPAAQGCTFGEIPEVSVLKCRSEFVVTSARIIQG